MHFIFEMNACTTLACRILQSGKIIIIIIIASHVLQSLHWHKIEQIIVYKLISIAYTTLQQNSPSYLTSKLELQSN